MLKKIFIFMLFFTLNSTADIQIKLLPPSGNQIYFSAFPDFGGSENIVTTQRIQTFETMVGKQIAWAYFSQNWFNGIVYPKAHIHAIFQSGAVPFVRLMPRSDEEQGHPEEVFTMQNIIDGVFDTELKKWAKDAKKDNIPMLVDFAVEMNGDWFPWSGVFTGGDTTDAYGDPTYPDGPERFRDAYRHIIDIFRVEDVKHITWFFHPDQGSYPNESWNKAKYYYPGDDYIDWIGFSLYGAQEITEGWEGLEFSTQLAAHYIDIKAISGTKPIALLEFGVTDNHPNGNKTTWFNDAFSTILNNPYIKFSAISVWHENWENSNGTYSTLRVDSSSEALTTFKKWAQDDRFISNVKFNRNRYTFLPVIYGLLLE
jgi:hypothetical protein